MEAPKGAVFPKNDAPYLDAAYNLARWITRNQHDAEDIVGGPTCAPFGFSAVFEAETDGPGSWRWSAMPH